MRPTRPPVLWVLVGDDRGYCGNIDPACLTLARTRPISWEDEVSMEKVAVAVVIGYIALGVLAVSAAVAMAVYRILT